MRRAHRILASLALAACSGSLSPLSNKLEIGEEPYVVFVGDTPDGAGELFAAPAAGNQAYQFTFTRLDERLPALSPEGGMVAFVRASGTGDTSRVTVWVMNLLNGADRRLTEPGQVVPDRLAWSADSRTIFLRTATGVFAAAAPPDAESVAPVEGAATGLADSALMVLLGDPPAAQARPCRTQAGLCALTAGGAETLLAADGTGPVRWGPDSVGYVTGGSLVVRPLGAGRTRPLRWRRGEVAHLREPTFFPGKGRQ